MQATEAQLKDAGEQLGPGEKVRAARKVWELREQMSAQVAWHRKASYR